MLIYNLKQEFYECVSTERILILVALDVDAVCACKIAKLLFQQDNVQYTIVPVKGEQDIKKSYDEHREQIKNYLLINCGGNTDLSYLEADEDASFFIVDSHRPFDLSNIFNEQIKLLVKDGDATLEEIPDADKVLEEDKGSDGDESDQSNDDDPDEPSSKRQRTGDLGFIEKKLEKKAIKRKKENERERLIEDYYEHSYYGSSVALVLYELAWNLSKDNNDLLWLGIVGLTEQYIFSKIDREKYFDDCTSIRNHVLRHNVADEDNVQSIDCMKIAFEKELRLTLYRHWSVFESFHNSQYTTCGLRLFTLKGTKKLHELFADMGVPITQCKQKYSSMDVDLRTNVKEWLETLADKYGLDDFTYGSFIAQYGYKTKLCGNDVVCAISALLEYSKDDRSYSENFLDAMDSLSKSKINDLMDGIELSKVQITTIVNQVRSFIDSHQIVCAGPFLYANVQEGSPTGHVFAHPIIIGRLARYTLESYSIMTRNKKARTLPFILAVPYDSEEGTSLVVGVPPVCDTSAKSFFGAAFRQAGEKTKSRIHHDFFDPTVIEIKTEDRSKFLDNLSALMC